MSPTDIFKALRSILGEEQIMSVVQDQLEDDLGNQGKVIVFPKTENEIIHVVKYSQQKGMKLTIEGRGTKRGYGGIQGSTDILLSLENHIGIVEHEAGDMTVTVKAGTRFKELQDQLAKCQQMVSLDPAWPEQATIGGVISANDSGPKRLGYGSARDAVIGMRIVYPDGEVIRTGGKVVKNVAGYDMNKLFVGSMGTLGIISEITLKLRPLPKATSLVLCSFTEAKWSVIRAFALQILDSMIEPVTLELLSSSLSEMLLGQPLYTLAIQFEDVESSVHYQEKFIENIQPENGQITILSENQAKQFWSQFSTITPSGRVARDSASVDSSKEVVLKIGVKNLNVLDVMKECERLADAYPVQIQSHGGLGHGLCEVMLKGDKVDIITTIVEMRTTVKQLGGYVVIKHAPLEIRQEIKVWGENPSYFFLIEGIKAKIDPHKMINDQRFVGGV